MDLTRPIEVNPSRALAVTVAAPFWLVGAVVAVLYVGVVLVGRGLVIGFTDVRDRLL